MQIPIDEQGQCISQPSKQICAVRFVQGNDDGSAMPFEGQWNGMKEVLVRGNKHGVVLLRVGKQTVVIRAGRKMFKSV